MASPVTNPIVPDETLFYGSDDENHTVIYNPILQPRIKALGSRTLANEINDRTLENDAIVSQIMMFLNQLTTCLTDIEQHMTNMEQQSKVLTDMLNKMKETKSASFLM